MLAPFDAFAAEYRCGILAVTHPPKAAQSKAINAFTGSLAFVAAARTAFIAIEDVDESDRPVAAGGQVQHRAARAGPGLSAGAHDHGRADAGDPAGGYGTPTRSTSPPTRPSAAAADGDTRKRGQKREAEEFLAAYLEARAMPADKVIAAAEANGISGSGPWTEKGLPPGGVGKGRVPGCVDVEVASMNPTPRRPPSVKGCHSKVATSQKLATFDALVQYAGKLCKGCQVLMVRPPKVANWQEAEAVGNLWHLAKGAGWALALVHSPIYCGIGGWANTRGCAGGTPPCRLMRRFFGVKKDFSSVKQEADRAPTPS